MANMIKNIPAYDRTPFITLDGEWYVDLLYNCVAAHTVDLADVLAFVRDTPPLGFVLARRLTACETKALLHCRTDVDDVYARVVPDRRRWPRRR